MRLRGLDAVDWESLTHACGPATTTAEELEMLTSDNAEERSRAFSELTSSIIHQGSVYPATAAAVPFLVEVATMESLPADARTAAVVMLCWIAEGNANLRRWHADVVGEPWAQSLAGGIRHATPGIIDLARHGSGAEMRTWAVWFVRMLPPSSGDLGALRDCLRTERDPVVRATIALGLPQNDPIQNDLLDAQEDALVRLCAAAQLIPSAGDMDRLIALAAECVPGSARFAEVPDRSSKDMSPIRLIASALGTVSVERQVDWIKRWLSDPFFCTDALYAASDAGERRRSAARLLVEPVRSVLMDPPAPNCGSTAAFALTELGLPGVQQLREISRSAHGALKETLDRYLHGSVTQMEWFKYEPDDSLPALREYVERDMRPPDVSALRDDLVARACAEAIARLEGSG
jgi:hypothetical protein